MEQKCAICGKALSQWNRAEVSVQNSTHKVCDDCHNKLITISNSSRRMLAKECQSIANDLLTSSTEPNAQIIINNYLAIGLANANYNITNDYGAGEKLASEFEKAQYKADSKLEVLKSNGAKGYYQYKILNLMDDDGNILDTRMTEGKLNALAMEGWQVKCAYSNDIKQNGIGVYAGGLAGGAQRMAAQHLLILERFIEFK